MKKTIEVELPGGGLVHSASPSFECEEAGCREKIAWGIGWATGWECENIYLCQKHLDAGIELLQGLKGKLDEA